MNKMNKKYIKQSLILSIVLISISWIYFFFNNKNFEYTYKLNYNSFLKTNLFEKYKKDCPVLFEYVQNTERKALHSSLKFLENDKSLFESYKNMPEVTDHHQLEQIKNRIRLEGAYYLSPELYGPVNIKITFNKKLNTNILPKFFEYLVKENPIYNLKLSNLSKDKLLGIIETNCYDIKRVEKELELLSFKLEIIKKEYTNENQIIIKINEYQNNIEKFFFNASDEKKIKIKEILEEIFRSIDKKSYYKVLQINRKRILDYINNDFIIFFNLEKLATSYEDNLNKKLKDIVTIESKKFNYKLFISLTIYSIFFSFFSIYLISNLSRK
jgi:hypothetical protein